MKRNDDMLMGQNGFFANSAMCVVLACFSLLLLPTPVEAYHLPKWEWGMGAGWLNVPVYRGAKGHKNYLLPVPFMAYRGESVRMDEDGMRGRLFESDRIRLDLSIAGNLPVSKDGDSARAGMPDLDPVGEFGPTLDISLVRNGKRHQGETSVWLRLPVRAALSVGEPLIGQQGWVFSPYLDLSYRKGMSRSHWRVSLALGPLYASRRYHEYFYKVPAEFATAIRPQYQPDGGYSGSRATFTLVMNSRRWFVGVFARYDQLNGAVFENSPLVEVNDYFAMGFAVSRIFGSSSEKAPH
ncbi:MAG: MipA/OmpV family protein [Gammaproteobacteria bacterium]